MFYRRLFSLCKHFQVIPLQVHLNILMSSYNNLNKEYLYSSMYHIL